MECKVGRHQAEDIGRHVLIKSLWNVKASVSSVLRNLCEVLIESLWNVKSGLLWPVLIVPDSIDRNIIECQRSRTIFYIGILPQSFPLNVNPTLNLHSTFAKSIVFQFFIPIIYADKAISGVDEIWIWRS